MNNETVAAAELHAELRKLILSARGNLTRLRALPTREVNDYTAVGQVVHFEGDIAVLRNVLLAIDRAELHLSVSSLAVDGQSSAAAADPEIVLRVRCEVFAYMRPQQWGSI